MLIAFQGRPPTVGALGDAESGLDVKPRRACPEACIYGVAALENGTTISLRAASCNCTLQATQRLQSINRDALKGTSIK
jgi:hypothetical protein